MAPTRPPIPSGVALAAAAVATSLLLAGCLGGGPQDGASSGAEAGEAPAADPGDASQAAGSAGGETPSQRDDWNATLEEPPPWEPGEWWTVEVTDVWRDETYSATLVVAGRHGDTYELGLAAGDFRDAIVVAHWPPLGEVDSRTLRFSVHDEPLTPARFPLEEGRTWRTTYEGVDGFTAEVREVDGTTARIRLVNDDNLTVRYTYDAEVETVTHLEDWLDRTYEVTDHGTGYEGEVVVPHGRTQQVRGRVVGALGPGGPLFGYGPAPSPSESARVGQPQASAVLLAGSVGLDAGVAEVPPPPGYYRESTTPPSGNTAVLEATGVDGLEATYIHVADAGGEWRFEHVAAGLGGAVTEIVAYDQRHVTLPLEQGGSP